MSNIDLLWKIMRATDLPVTFADDGFYTTDYDVDPMVQHFIGYTPIEAAQWLAWDHLAHCIDFDCDCVALTDNILATNDFKESDLTNDQKFQLYGQAGPDNQFDS